MKHLSFSFKKGSFLVWTQAMLYSVRAQIYFKPFQYDNVFDDVQRAIGLDCANSDRNVNKALM